MPRAPSSQPQVAPRPLPSARLTAVASPDIYGAGAADAITRAAANIYERYSLEADQVAFMEADTKAAKAQTDIQLQVRDLQGKDAAGAPDVARQKWQQAMGEIQPTLTGPRQQRAFARAAAGRWEELYKTTQFHVAEQTTKYADQTTESSIKASTDEARLNAAFPDSIEAAKRRQVAVLHEWAGRKGLPLDGPVYQEQEAKVLSNTNAEVVKGLLYAGNDITASAFYQAHVTEFVAADRDHIEAALKEGSTRGEALRRTNAIMGMAGADYKAALAEVTKITDPKVEELAREMVHKRFAEAEAIKKKEVDDIYLKATNGIEQNPGVAPRLLVPPDQWAKLSLSERNSLEARSTEGGDRPNNDQRWLKYMALTPDVKASMGLAEFKSQYWMHFDNATRIRAEKEFQQYHDAAYAEGKKPPATTTTLTFKEQFFNEMIQSGLFPADKSPTQLNPDMAQRYARLEGQAAAAVESFELAHKRKATVTEIHEEIVKIKDRAIKEVFISGAGFFGGAQKKVIADVAEDEKGRAIVPVDKIPEAERQNLARYLQSRGVTPTPSKMERAYAQVLLGDRRAFEMILSEAPGPQGPTLPVAPIPNLP